MQFGDEELSLQRLEAAVDTARDCGFAAVSANDHFIYQTPWLDGPTALASMIERSGDMTLATTVSLAVLRGPVPMAKALTALDILSEGRLVAGVGPGSSERDYDALGISFEERWKRFDEAVAVLRALLKGEAFPENARFYPVPSDVELAPGPRQQGGVPLWIGSWGSKAGLARVARAADGWLASAYNTTPEGFSAARSLLASKLEDQGREADDFPNALATMWTWVSEDEAEADRALTEVLAPLLKRDPDELRGQVCVGTAEHCADLLSRYAEAGCRRVYLWPLGDEKRQLELVASEVAPSIGAQATR
jgi:alkanesulfonate monooxygenase SsuD/methylene tetrahydromethanopterin reductase-like flavin-dependent oxidoreductase (luciferase family)